MEGRRHDRTNQNLRSWHRRISPLPFVGRSRSLMAVTGQQFSKKRRRGCRIAIVSQAVRRQMRQGRKNRGALPRESTAVFERDVPGENTGELGARETHELGYGGGLSFQNDTTNRGHKARLR